MRTIEDLIVKDKDFAEAMEGEILPLLKEIAKDGYLTSKDGLKLHYQYYINPQEKASIVISHGFCEFISKFAETIYYFYQMGYSVFMIEHRGHGLSDRQVQSYSIVHVNHFEDYVDDFNLFIEKVVVPESLTEHLYLFGHSMGGAIGALYLEKYPKVFEKAVLTSPMLELSLSSNNKFVINLLCLLSYLPFFNKKFIPGHHEYDHKYKFPHCSTMTKARYNYVYNEREREPHYRSNGASFGWGREAVNVSKKILKNAHLVKIPVILMQASLDNLVSPEGHAVFASKAVNCRVIRFEECKHEIFNATDDIILEYYKDLYEFFE
ncbi:MAG: alpha/beta hydrolase [Pseudobutyrivibrio sp.]|nr:alpha/beta hydrolase [Pseudobutyrivibrio sp.]